MMGTSSNAANITVGAAALQKSRASRGHEDESSEPGWLSSLFDIKCCTMRDRSTATCAGYRKKQFPPIRTSIDSPQPHQQISDSSALAPLPVPLRSVSHLLDASPAHASPNASPVHASPNASPVHASANATPVHASPHASPVHASPQIPADLVDKIKSLISKNPYIAREIGEASHTLRAQFLIQCMRGNKGRCQQIWGSLDEETRRLFAQAARLNPNTTDQFFLNILEPDMTRRAKEPVTPVSCGSEFDLESVSTESSESNFLPKQFSQMSLSTIFA